MPRKPRIEFAGAFYHVIARGNQRQKIFKDVADYDKYHQLLTVYRNRYHFHLYAYVFMGNHVHLLLETGEVPLSKVLQGINQTYTMYFNRKYRTVGHLFQGRYKSILCDREAYLLGLLKYIHENPLRARIVDAVDEYRWSSHHAYTGKSNALSLVSVDQVLRLFSENKSRARRRYLEFMLKEKAMKKAEVYATIDQRLQGDETFVDAVVSRLETKVNKEPRKKERSLEQISAVVQERYLVSLDQLRSPGKGADQMNARRVLSQAAKRYGYKGKEIAEYLRKDPASVSGYLRGGDHDSNLEQIMRILTNM